ncbi:MAG TPA: hypothetical protein VMW91_08385 [Desulfosporosinus sp.]|nr:hypothetical protein [Desulfosporosinus sp.]
MNSKNSNPMVPLIVPEFSDSAMHRHIVDRGGGELRGMKEVFTQIFGEKRINTEILRTQLEERINQVGEILNQLGQNITEGWELNTVNVGLGISTEGSIGIASAGVEATIQVEFVRKAT